MKYKRVNEEKLKCTLKREFEIEKGGNAHYDVIPVCRALHILLSCLEPSEPDQQEEKCFCSGCHVCKPELEQLPKEECTCRVAPDISKCDVHKKLLEQPPKEECDCEPAEMKPNELIECCTNLNCVNAEYNPAKPPKAGRSQLGILEEMKKRYKTDSNTIIGTECAPDVQYLLSKIDELAESHQKIVELSWGADVGDEFRKISSEALKKLEEDDDE